MNEAREALLARVREALGASRELLQREAQPALQADSYPAHVLPAEEDLVVQFSRELGKLTGKIHLCADAEAALEELRSLLQQHGAREVITWSYEQIGLEGLETLLKTEGVAVLPDSILGAERGERLQQLEPAVLCISGADAAVAESGTLLVVAGEGRGRLASLLAPVHVAVLPASRLRPGLAGALELLRERFGEQFLHRHSNLALITGPSRTADIELSLTLGVHGPKEIHALIMLDR